MAITTLASAISKIQYPRDIVKTITAGSFLATSWGQGSLPVIGAYDTTLNGVALASPVTGQIDFPAPASAGYLSRIELEMGTSGSGAVIYLLDRIWHNGGITITSTSPQTIVSPAWPARDNNGVTNGDGLFMAVEVSATAGAATPTISISYTNSAGTAGRTSTNIQATVSASATGRMFEMSLQSGDTGVQSIQSVTLSASWLSGTINLVVYRPLAVIPMPFGNGCAVLDVISGCFPTLYTGSVPYFTTYNGFNPVLVGKVLFSDG